MCSGATIRSGKIPTLITDDGKAVFDSRVILEYLDHVAGGGRLIPAAWPARIETLTLQAMADGVMDACILIVYEARHRPEALHHPPWLDYQRGKVVRGLTAFAKQPADPARFDVGTITAACMLGYLDCESRSTGARNSRRWSAGSTSSAPGIPSSTPPPTRIERMREAA